MTTWMENDTLFRQQLETGHEYATYVADRIRRATNLTVDVTPLRFRDSVDDRHQFANEHDLLVASSVRLEVKSRNIPFTGPHDFPYPSAFVYSARGWNAKASKPSAIVHVSQPTGGMVVVGASTRPHWVVSRRYDRVRDIVCDVFEVPVAHLREFDELTAWLQAL